MTVPDNLFWDTCVFIRYLAGDRKAACFEDIELFVEEAKQKKRKIYFSTLTFAEIKHEHFKGAGFGSISEFFRDMGSNFIPIEPVPNILICAGELRSVKTQNPYPKAETTRDLATPDAILLQTCVFIRDILGVDDIIFHTFDEGKARSANGKSVPLLGFENWYPSTNRPDCIKKVCSLRREKPLHPQPLIAGLH